MFPSILRLLQRKVLSNQKRSSCHVLFLSPWCYLRAPQLPPTSSQTQISRLAVRPVLLQGHRFLVVLRRHRGRPGTIARPRPRQITFHYSWDVAALFTLKPLAPATASCRFGSQSIRARQKSPIQRPSSSKAVRWAWGPAMGETPVSAPLRLAQAAGK